jgi:hypothetical protein
MKEKDGGITSHCAIHRHITMIAANHDERVPATLMWPVLA